MRSTRVSDLALCVVLGCLLLQDVSLSLITTTGIHQYKLFLIKTKFKIVYSACLKVMMIFTHFVAKQDNQQEPVQRVKDIVREELQFVHQKLESVRVHRQQG